nr:MAG TPA: hypothetical protein [Caudoviricetes sp.]
MTKRNIGGVYPPFFFFFFYVPRYICYEHQNIIF